MKKLLLIALITVGFLMAAAPKSEARVFVNFGIRISVLSIPGLLSCLLRRMRLLSARLSL